MFAVTISSALLLKLHNNNNNIYSILFINHQFSYIIQNHYNITKAFIQKAFLGSPASIYSIYKQGLHCTVHPPHAR